jgi:MFS family permease
VSTGSAAARSEIRLPQTSVLAQLRATPRVFVFMGVLVGAAVSLGAKEVARWQYLNEAFQSEWGLGIAAAITAVSVAIASTTLGRIIDRRDPRPFVVVAVLLPAVSNGMTGLVLMAGPISPAWVLVSSVLDGIILGIAGVALLKTQAAFVRPGAEGAAEILNILRAGIGGVVGALLAGMSPSPAVTLQISTVLLLATAVGVWWVMRPITPRPPSRARTGMIVALSYLRQTGSLRRLVLIDLTLALVIPTQLVSLVLVGMDAPEVAGLSIAAGMVGVLLGRLGLVAIGFRGNPRRLLALVVGGLCFAQLVGVVLLTDGWLIRQLLVLPAIIIVGSVCSTYAQGVTAAIIQQAVPEEHRGGLASVLVTGRNALISIAAIGGAALAVAWGPQVFLLVLALGLLAVLLGSRRFASVPS